MISLVVANPHRTLDAIRRAAGRPQWTRRQIDELVDLHRRGFSTRRIAHALGRHHNSVWSKIKSLKRKGAL